MLQLTMRILFCFLIATIAVSSYEERNVDGPKYLRPESNQATLTRKPTASPKSKRPSSSPSAKPTKPTKYPSAKPSKSGKSVIVIGGGVSGLAAANALQAKNYNVIVVEARDYLGGRLHTDRSNFGFPVELGAQFLHGSGSGSNLQPVYKLATDKGWKLQTFTEKSDTRSNGAEYDDTHLWNVYNAFNTWVYDTLQSSLKDLSYSMKSAIDKYAAQYLSASDKNLLLNAFSSADEGDYGADASQMSAVGYGVDGEFSGADHVLPDGYDQLTNYLSSTIPTEKIKLSEPVKSVDYSGTKVSVTTTKGTYTADYCIVTIPLGVLQAKSVTFSPALPSDKLTAISRMGMGLLDKIVMQFSTKFWPTGYNWIETVLGASPWNIEFSDMEIISPGKNLLVMWHYGSLAMSRESMDDNSILNDVAIPALRQAFGSAAITPTKFTVTRWGNDPYSLGSYSYIKINEPVGDISTLAKNVNNKLFFAGEATHSKYFQTVHGAYLTGLREANNIIALN